MVSMTWKPLKTSRSVPCKILLYLWVKPKKSTHFSKWQHLFGEYLKNIPRCFMGSNIRWIPGTLKLLERTGLNYSQHSSCKLLLVLFHGGSVGHPLLRLDVFCSIQRNLSTYQCIRWYIQIYSVLSEISN